MKLNLGSRIRDFHFFETEVQIIMDLIGRRRKILVTMSSGKSDPHGFNVLLLSDIVAFKERGERERERERERLMAMAFTECVCVEKAKGKEGLWTISGLWIVGSRLCE